MKTLLIFPSVFEADAVFKNFSHSAKLGKFIAVDKNLGILVSGIGCNKSKERVEKAIENFSPQIVVLMGYCGACSTSLKNGDFVFETSNEQLKKHLSTLDMLPVRIASVEKTADEQTKEFLQKQGFDAVEMESRYFQSIVQNANIEFLHIRCVSDAKNSAIPADLMDCSMDRQTGNINPLKMLSVSKLFRNPSILIKLIKFGIEIAPTQKIYKNRAIKVANLINNEKLF
ncbi:MAG: hypothetical protein E7035_09130 [Verrucomicrobiaceae bacterium]|nr:hypothetical protein [Verrucomicrobiaceae bacterium]